MTVYCQIYPINFGKCVIYWEYLCVPSRRASLQDKSLPKSPAIDRLMKKISKKNGKGETALHTAAIKGSRRMVKTLLQLGADPNAQVDYQLLPLTNSTSHRLFHLIKHFLRPRAHCTTNYHITNCLKTPLKSKPRTNRIYFYSIHSFTQNYRCKYIMFLAGQCRVEPPSWGLQPRKLFCGQAFTWIRSRHWPQGFCQRFAFARCC